jgi:hypothetical protein
MSKHRHALLKQRNTTAAQSASRYLSTAYGPLLLARPRSKAEAHSLIMTLARTTDALTRKDIADWRAAWQMAINVDFPDRQRLYDIYTDVSADMHLSGCIQQRSGFVLSRSFKLVDAHGEEDVAALHFFEQEWFDQLVDHILDANYWGHSLIELGDLATDGDGCLTFDHVCLVPRKHVIPEYGRCVRSIGEDWHTGIPYREPPYAASLIEVGRPSDLGLYLKAAQATIPKKNALSFWDAFAEIFGMPMRVAKTQTRDPKEWQRLQSMMQDAGSALSMITSGDTDIQFIESGRGDAFNVYDQRIARANSELSKLIIGQTMTIEDGSSLSQSQTHLQVFMNLVEKDRKLIRNVVNNQLIPRMTALGFPVGGLRMEWNDAVDYTPDQQLAYETMIADRFEVDPKYFADKYGLPVGERRDAAADFFD